MMKSERICLRRMAFGLGVRRARPETIALPNKKGYSQKNRRKAGTPKTNMDQSSDWWENNLSKRLHKLHNDTGIYLLTDVYVKACAKIIAVRLMISKKRATIEDIKKHRQKKKQVTDKDIEKAMLAEFCGNKYCFYQLVKISLLSQ